MAILFAVVLTFARASQDREITALRAAGVSARVPMVAALLVGLTASLATGYATHYLIPWAHFHKFRVISDAIRGLYMQTEMSGDRMSFEGFQMTWDHRDDQGHFHEVVARINRGAGGDTLRARQPMSGVFYADEAWLTMTDSGETLGLTFADMWSLTQGSVGRITLSVDLRALSDDTRRNESDKDLPSDQLLGEVERGVHQNAHGAEFTVFLRSTFALLPALFGPIGFCIGVLARNRGRMTALLMAMVPLAFFHACVVLSRELVQLIDVPLFGLLPAVALALLGIPFCWRFLRV